MGLLSLNWPTQAIILTEFCERFAYYGILSSLQLFLRNELNEGTALSIIVVNLFSSVCYFSPLIGGHIADHYTGRYRVIFFTFFIYTLGVIGVAFVAFMYDIYNWHETSFVIFSLLFFFSLFIMALATGGIKANVFPFGSDQLDDQSTSYKDDLQSFSGWFYFGINVGALLAYTFVAYLCQNVSFGIGWGLPAIFIVIALMIFWNNRHVYHYVPPTGSKMVEVYACSIQAWNRRHIRKIQLGDHIEDSRTAQPASGIRRGTTTLAVSYLDDEEHSIQENDENNEEEHIEEQLPTHWLDVAKIAHGGTFDEETVEEVKQFYRLLPYFLFQILYFIVYATQSTLFFSQGCQMDYRVYGFSVPVAFINIGDTCIILILIPLLEKKIYPYLRTHFGFRITTLQRTGFGFFITTLAMIAAGILEIERKNTHKMNGKTSTCGNDDLPMHHISIFWLLIISAMVGASEVFSVVAGLEYFYSESPASCKSTIFSFSLMATAIGALLNSLTIVLVNSNPNDPWITNNLDNGHLEYYYFLMAGLMFITLLAFIPFAKKYVYREDLHSQYMTLKENEEDSHQRIEMNVTSDSELANVSSTIDGDPIL